MEKTGNIITMRSHFINALLPRFLKHFFYNSIFLIILYPLYLIVDHSSNLNFKAQFIFILIFLTILFSIIKMTNDLIKIINTTYSFYPNHLEVKFKFISENTHSINYKQITDIQVSKTIWDRVCNVGDIIIHTANDTHLNEDTKALRLKDMKYPDRIESELTRKIHSYQHQNNT